MPVQAVNLRVVDSVSSSSKEMKRVPCVIETHVTDLMAHSRLAMLFGTLPPNKQTTGRPQVV